MKADYKPGRQQMRHKERNEKRQLENVCVYLYIDVGMCVCVCVCVYYVQLITGYGQKEIIILLF